MPPSDPPLDAASAPDASPAERVNDLPRMLEAITRAIREAVQAHKRAGNPIAVWRDGQVVWLQPEEIPDEAEAEGARSWPGP